MEGGGEVGELNGRRIVDVEFVCDIVWHEKSIVNVREQIRVYGRWRKTLSP